MPKIPPYVDYIQFCSELSVAYSTRALRDALTEAGYEVFKTKHCVCNVRLHTQGQDGFHEQPLIDLVFLLNGLGVPFGEDYKLPLSPADYMRDLQQKKVLQGPFKSIGWSGPGHFVVKVIEPQPDR